jgi:hypothetical protein
VASPQLTLHQFAALTLGPPPWHFAPLLKRYNRYSMSLQQVIKALSAVPVTLYFRPGNFAVFLAEWTGYISAPYLKDNSPAVRQELENGYWTSALQDVLTTRGYATFDQFDIPYPDSTVKEIFVKLADLLKPVGAIIVYLDDNWQTVGISGTIGAFANLNASVLPAAPPANFISDVGISDAAAAGAVVLAPLSGEAGETIVLSASPYSALSTAMVGSVPIGLLAVYLANKKSGIPSNASANVVQVLAQHLQISQETIVNLLVHTIPLSANGLAAAVQDVSAYIGWLNYFGALDQYDSSTLPAAAPVLAIGGNITVPAITIQPAGSSSVVTVSALTVQPDGTSTGGVVSG